MEININKPIVAANTISNNIDVSADVRKPEVRQVQDLSISHSASAPEDVTAAGISADALTRDDALGKLVGSAFALPPPPMPNFT